MSYALREPKGITPNEVKALMDGGEPLVVVDIRTPEDYAASDLKIKGAIRIPPDEVQRLLDLSRDQTIVLYCSSPGEEKSAAAARTMLAGNFTDVHPLLGGFAEWLRRGFPVEPR